MNPITSLDIIQTMLGVTEATNTSETAKKLAIEIIDRKVKEMYDRMIENSAKSAGLIT